jgi:RNA polymerase sigma factor (sigma-70 family)
MRESHSSQRSDAGGNPLSAASIGRGFAKIERERHLTEQLLEKLPSLSAIVTTSDRKTFGKLQRVLEACSVRVEVEARALETLRRERIPPCVSEEISARRSELSRRADVIEDLIKRAASISISLKTLPGSVEILKPNQSRELLRTFTDLRQAFWRKLYELPIVQNTARDLLASVLTSNKKVGSVLHISSAKAADEDALRARVAEAQRKVREILHGVEGRQPTLRQRGAIAKVVIELPIDPDDVNELFQKCCVKVEQLAAREIGLIRAHGSCKAGGKAGDVSYGVWKELAAELGGNALEARASIEELKSLYEPYVRVKQYLAMSNYRYVCSLVEKIDRFKGWREDLKQDGMIGMMRGIEKFDVDSGNALLTYASCWVFQMTSREHSRLAQLVTIPSHQQEVLRELRELLSLDDRRSEKDLAAVLGADLEDVQFLRPFVYSMASVDGIRNGRGEYAGAGILRDRRPVDIDNGLDREARNKIIDKALGRLSHRERQVLVLRFGLDGGEPKTLIEVGRVFKVTRERIRQIQETALEALREGPFGRGLVELIPETKD